MNKWQNFKYKMIERIRQMMVGRYGPDELYQFATYFLMVIILLNIFLNSQILRILTLILLVLNMIRPFSKNYQARYKENALFLKSKRAFTSRFKLVKQRFTDKDHAYRTCPNCKKVLRLPRKKGKHIVNCPNCHKEFKVII